VGVVPFSVPSMPALAPGARRYGYPPILLGLLLFPLPISSLLGVALVALGVAALLFHRDPERRTPDSGVVSPADGTVSVIRAEGDQVRVGVYMSAADVHVNRAPLGGEVKSVTHRPGANKMAFSKESERNERVDIDFGEFEVSLIAGWFARRIHPYLSEGDSVERGDRIGHISFGSRADILLPESFEMADLTVEEGDSVLAGETILAVSDD
jgi:phosphatidylserine decarboxylase